MRKVLKLAVGAAVVAATLGFGTPAQAYCGPELVDSGSSSNSGCSNSCQDSAAAYQKLTKRTAPWDCPM